MNFQKKSFAIVTLAFAFLSLGNCETKSADSAAQGVLLASLVANTVKVNSAAELASESNDNYDLNQFGLVTSTKVKSWIDNWGANKPTGITGKLVVVLFYPSGTYTKQYLRPSSGVNVFDWTTSVYSSTDRFAYRTSRNNGIINDPNTLPTGAITDEILQTYGIDPTKDLVVFAAGSDRGAGTNALPRGTVYQNLGRAIYWLRYWGVPKENLAILNGAIDANSDFTASYLTTDSSILSTPTKGSFSVKSLKTTDNSILVQPLENIISFAKNPSGHGITGVNTVLFADARHNTTDQAAEYLGSNVALTIGVSGAALFAGHIKGARFTPWPLVINQTTGKFKTKAELAALWNDFSTFHSANTNREGVQANQTIVHYCRTNARSMVSGMSAFLILGKPSIFYENSFIEWSALSANHPVSSLRTLPAGHRFATDTADLTETTPGSGPAFNSSASVAQYATFAINTSATTTRLNIDEDKAYKNQ